MRVDIQEATKTSLTGSASRARRRSGSRRSRASRRVDLQFGGAVGESATVDWSRGPGHADRATPDSHAAGSPVTVGGKSSIRRPSSRRMHARMRASSTSARRAPKPPSTPGRCPTPQACRRTVGSSRPAVPPLFYGPPLVAWNAAPAATKYEIQWGPCDEADPTLAADGPDADAGDVGDAPACTRNVALSRPRDQRVPSGQPEDDVVRLAPVQIAKPTFSVSGG